MKFLKNRLQHFMLSIIVYPETPTDRLTDMSG